MLPSHLGGVCLWLIVLSNALAYSSLFSVSGYAGSTAPCPLAQYGPQPYSIVRFADGLSSGEASYRTARSAVAATRLRGWIQQFNGRSHEEVFDTSKMPVVALASSAGGIRSLLLGAGFVQGLDDRDSNTSVSGLYQGITYHSGHEAGALLVGSLAGNDFPTISLLRQLWNTGFRNDEFLPSAILPGEGYSKVVLNMTAKIMTGLDVSMVDAWAGLLAYQMLFSHRPELHMSTATTSLMSGISGVSNWTHFGVPYPIITSSGIEPANGRFECYTTVPGSTEFEWHPYEFGSWDDGARAFAQMEFLGSALQTGTPLSRTSCITGFDGIAFATAVSWNTLNLWCTTIPNIGRIAYTGLGRLDNEIIAMTNTVHALTYFDEYGVIPNPFRGIEGLPAVNDSRNLYLVGGHQGDRDIPLWPLIQPERQVDVIIVNDNSAAVAGTGWPDGFQLYEAYKRAHRSGNDRMPPIPDLAILTANNVTHRALTAFGCGISNAITILYIPNREMPFPSNQSTFQITWDQASISAMIENGKQLANGFGSGGDDVDFGSCLACLMMQKETKVPRWCQRCFDEYCWNTTRTADMLYGSGQ